MLRDWELLNVLNGVSSGLGVFPDTVPAMDGAGAEVEDLKQIFDEDISNPRRCCTDRFPGPKFFYFRAFRAPTSHCRTLSVSSMMGAEWLERMS